MLRTIARNIISNWVGYAINAVVIFFLTPFVLHSLGDTRYGIWILVNGLTGYFGLLNLGLSGGTTQYLTRYLAQRDYEALNRAASASVLGLSACGVVVVLTAAVLGWLAPWIFDIPEASIDEVRLCVAVLGVTTAAQFAFFPYHAVFTALQRFDLSNAIAVPLRLASAAGTYVALQLNYGLVGLCTVNATSELLGCLIRMRFAHVILPQLRISPRLAGWRDFRPILSYGLVNSLIEGAGILKSYSSSLLIGLFMPLAALAPFNLAAGLVLQIDRLFGPISMVFFPLATQLDAQGDRDKQRLLYFSGSRIFLSGGVAVAIIGAIWAGDFFRLWVGERFVAGGEFTSVVALFWVLMLAATVGIGQKIGYQVLLGRRAMKTLTFIAFTESVATLVLLIPLVPVFGLLGAVLATLIPVLVVQGLVMPLAICRLLQVPSVHYFRTAYVRPALLGVLGTPPLLLLHYALPVHDSWRSLGLCGCLAAIVTGPLALWIGLNRDERNRLLIPLARKFREWWCRRVSVDATI